ncbi:MAG: hypothetical protein ACHQ1G_00735 [Planctomycetota bacterium]
MERHEFKVFVEQVLEDVVGLAETHLGQPLPRPPRFPWSGRDAVIDREVVDEIVARIYTGPSEIRPCVDIGVAALDNAGRPLVVASVSGYAACPFGTSWTGRRGPFNYFVGDSLLGGERLDSLPKGRAFLFQIVMP